MNRLALLATAIVVVTVAVLLLVIGRAAADPMLEITSPAPGEQFQRGDIVSVLVDTHGVTFDGLVATVPGGAGRASGGSGMIQLPLPADVVGPVTLRIAGRVGTTVLRDSVEILVLPDFDYGSAIEVPELMAVRPAEEESLSLHAYVEGVDIDVTGLQESLIETAHPSVATVRREESQGKTRFVITGIDYGVASLLVYLPGGTQRIIRLEVGLPRFRGDLTDDTRIDAKDEKIIRDALGRPANPEDPRDLNGNGVIDKGDIDVLKGLLSCGSASDKSLVMGGGSAKTDCFGEFSLAGELLLDSRKCVPKSKQPCTDGAACDLDGAADGACTFNTRLIFNHQDLRLPACVSPGIASYELLKPSEKDSEKNADDAMNRMGLLDALAGVGALPFIGSLYTSDVDLRVRLKSSRNGPKKASRAFKLRTVGIDGQKDTDTIVLVCLPPALASPSPTPVPTNTPSPVSTDTGFLLGGSQTGGWVDGQNLFADDDLDAVGMKVGSVRPTHQVGGFGFSLPSDATVTGIEVQIEGHVGVGNYFDDIFTDLSYDGGSSFIPAYMVNPDPEGGGECVSTTPGTPNCRGSGLSGGRGTWTIGGSTDTWGRSWSPGEISDLNFRVRMWCWARGTTPTNTCRADYVQARVFYTTPPPSPTPTPTATAGCQYTFVTKWGTLGSGDGQLNGAYHLAVDAADNVYVTERENFRVQKFTSDGVFLGSWGSYGAGDGQFDTPSGVATDGTHVYVTDRLNHRIHKFTTAGTFVLVWGTRGTGDGQFDQPTGVALDTSGKVYVADRNNHRIQIFDGNGGFVGKIGTVGSLDGELLQPRAVAVDATGNLYVADTGNNRIQKFSSGGFFLTKWGGPGGSGVGELMGPEDVRIDGGNVYVADTTNRRIQKFSQSGTFIGQWGMSGSGGGEFRGPTGVAVDSASNVYVADIDRIQKFACITPSPTATPSPTPTAALPVPAINNFTPSSVTLNTGAVDLSFTGQNFSTGILYLLWGASDPPGLGSLRATPASSTLATYHVDSFGEGSGVGFPERPGTYFVQLYNPVPSFSNGQRSNTVQFAVYQPSPVISSITGTCRAGQTCNLFNGYDVRVNGSGFVFGDSDNQGALSLQWDVNGTPIPRPDLNTRPVGTIGQLTVGGSVIVTAGTYTLRVCNYRTASGTVCASGPLTVVP
ncbi:MAG: 6-bladed beta-propeller [Patescibacteria group bacterium]